MCGAVTVPVCPCELVCVWGGRLIWVSGAGGDELVRPGPCSTCASMPVARYLTLCPCGSVSSKVHPWVSLRAYSLGVGVGPSQCVSVSSVCLATQGLGCPHGAPPALARPCPAPRLQGNPPRGGRGRGARLQAPTCPRPRAGPRRHAGAGRGSEREAGRGGAAAEQAGARGIAGLPETRRGATCERGTREAAATPVSRQQW